MNHLKVRANGLDFHLIDYGGSGEVVFCYDVLVREVKELLSLS